MFNFRGRTFHRHRLRLRLEDQGLDRGNEVTEWCQPEEVDRLLLILHTPKIITTIIRRDIRTIIIVVRHRLRWDCPLVVAILEILDQQQLRSIITRITPRRRAIRTMNIIMDILLHRMAIRLIRDKVVGGVMSIRRHMACRLVALPMEEVVEEPLRFILHLPQTHAMPQLLIITHTLSSHNIPPLHHTIIITLIIIHTIHERYSPLQIPPLEGVRDHGPRKTMRP